MEIPDGFLCDHPVSDLAGPRVFRRDLGNFISSAGLPPPSTTAPIRPLKVIQTQLVEIAKIADVVTVSTAALKKPMTI